ncbi:streptosactin export ABC transporter GggC [Streptococcus rupicaprae]
MLKQFISKKHLFFYFIFIVITWLEAVITPKLVSMIVSSFEKKNLEVLWHALLIGILGNLFIIVGLAGKRYYYARILSDFTISFKKKIFHQFLYGTKIKKDDVLSDLENDVKQLENSYLEPAVIIISSLGFTVVSIIYALVTNFSLGLIFIFFYSIPALCSGIGSKKLDKLLQEQSLSNQEYLSQATNIIDGERVIKNYQAETFFFTRFLSVLSKRIDKLIYYEKQRTTNNLIINSIDAFCSVVPLIIGGFMTYNGYLSGSVFVGIYLVSHNISYQFSELSYFINTYKSTKQLRDKYSFLLTEKAEERKNSTFSTLFPIRISDVSLALGDKIIFKNFSLDVSEGDKVAVIGPSGCGKSTLLNMIYGDVLPDSGEITFQGKVMGEKKLSHAMAYILQESFIFDGMSIEDNIALGKAKDYDRIVNILNRVGLSSLKGHILYSQNLSGGEKQRIEIARSLYHDSQLILADEVKSNLDKANAQQVSDILLQLPQTLIEVIHHYDNNTLARYDKVVDLSS